MQPLNTSYELTLQWHNIHTSLATWESLIQAMISFLKVEGLLMQAAWRSFPTSIILPNNKTSIPWRPYEKTWSKPRLSSRTWDSGSRQNKYCIYCIIIMEKLAVSQKDCEAIDNIHIHIWVRGTYNKTMKQHVGYRYWIINHIRSKYKYNSEQIEYLLYKWKHTEHNKYNKN